MIHSKGPRYSRLPVSRGLFSKSGLPVFFSAAAAAFALAAAPELESRAAGVGATFLLLGTLPFPVWIQRKENIHCDYLLQYKCVYTS